MLHPFDHPLSHFAACCAALFNMAAQSCIQPQQKEVHLDGKERKNHGSKASAVSFSLFFPPLAQCDKKGENCLPVLC